MEMTTYRVYPGGEILHEDEFAERDADPQPYDDYAEYTIPSGINPVMEQALVELLDNKE